VVLSTGLCKTGSRQSAKLSRLLLKGEVPREEPLPHGWERLDRGSPAMASRACRAGSKGERYGCQRPRAKGKKMEQGGALLGARLGDFLGALAGSREEQDARLEMVDWWPALEEEGAGSLELRLGAGHGGGKLQPDLGKERRAQGVEVRPWEEEGVGCTGASSSLL